MKFPILLLASYSAVITSAAPSQAGTLVETEAVHRHDYPNCNSVKPFCHGAPPIRYLYRAGLNTCWVKVCVPRVQEPELGARDLEEDADEQFARKDLENDITTVAEKAEDSYLETPEELNAVKRARPEKGSGHPNYLLCSPKQNDPGCGTRGSHKVLKSVGQTKCIEIVCGPQEQESQTISRRDNIPDCNQLKPDCPPDFLGSFIINIIAFEHGTHKTKQCRAYYCEHASTEPELSASEFHTVSRRDAADCSPTRPKCARGDHLVSQVITLGARIRRPKICTAYRCAPDAEELESFDSELMARKVDEDEAGDDDDPEQD